MRLDEELLLGAQTVREKIKSTITEHIGRAIALLAVIVCTIFTFTEVAFIDISLEKFTVEGVVVLALALVMYLSLESEGEVYARAQSVYLEAKRRADTLADKVKGEDLSPLRTYLLEVYEDEVKAREERLLLAYGISPEELLKYRSGEKSEKKKARRLRRIARVRSRAILPNELLFFDGEARGDISTAPRRQGRLFGMLRILPSVLCTLLTVAVMIDLKEGFSLRLVFEGVLKLSALLSMGLRGYLAGVQYVNEALIPYHKLREKLLESFLKKRT